jgi:hypothetical protein
MWFSSHHFISASGRSKRHVSSAGWTGPGFLQFSGVTTLKFSLTSPLSASE